ncbi:hypothetical protein DYB37_008429 [Aphanomyces astaci]|uniref:Uncharacterized protein n=1 Tax=Aphanomyces astaci TaxID=112090 RepID=A0A418EMK2_APHAT|nr:hypothetical protein DYB35_007981 [Aphanomyces astaci]RHZ15756.1 hypothetical protein DYB37_008429 [Aphanomyces astaci]
MDENLVWDDDGDGFDFLPPVDDAIFNNILHGMSVATHDSPLTVPSKRGRARGLAWRTQMLTLHETKAELEAALQDLERRHSQRIQLLSTSERKWERIARNQLELKLKALRENDFLRASVAEQHQFAQELDAVMMKIHDHQWRVLKLSAQGEKRLAAIHDIAERQLEHMECELVTTGLMDTSSDDGAFSHRHISTGPDQFYVEGMLTFESAGTSVKVESSVILKRRMVDCNHVRLVFRSILDDEAHPFAADSYVSDQYGWFDVQQVGTATTLMCYTKATSARDQHPPSGSKELDDLLALLESVHLDKGKAFAKDMSPAELAKDIMNASSRAFGARVEQLLMATDDELAASSNAC